VLKNIFDIERLIHSTKSSIACIIGILLTYWIGYPASQWVVISIVVVMCAQIYVGSVKQKAFLRFLGTLIGCLFAAITLALVGENKLAMIATIAISTFIFSYLAISMENFGYAATLGAATTAIILLGQNPTLSFALQRFLEISFGVLIAALVSQFILPIHASSHLRRSQAKTLEQLRNYYLATLMPSESSSPTEDHDVLNENIVRSLAKQRQLAKESASEPLGTNFDPQHFVQSLNCERDILRSITFMHTALSHIKKIDKIFNKQPGSHAFNETIIQSLNTLVKAIESNEEQESHIHTPSLYLLKEELQKNIESPSREELIYVDGFLFSAEVLTKSLARLARLYNVKVYETT
jgi:uncharacterized membrane protein YccC